MDQNTIVQVAKQLQIKQSQVENTLSLLQQGQTIPFIARYRKEQTQGLDENQIREIEKMYQYQVNLSERKLDVIRLIEEKGMLTDQLSSQIMNCAQLSEVEDLYRPFKEKKKTKASEAIKKGLEPLAKWMYQPEGIIEEVAKQYLNDEVETIEQAIEGALHIISEYFSDSAQNRQLLKTKILNEGLLICTEKKKHDDEKKVFENYYNFSSPVSKLVSHRILALNRAENQKVITVNIELDMDQYISKVLQQEKLDGLSTADLFLQAYVDGYKRLLFPSVQREIRAQLTHEAQLKALDNFSLNLEQLLMQPTIKDKVILGVDPAFRTGCKLAVVDATGKLLDIDVIYPVMPKNDVVGSERKVLSKLEQFKVDLIVIGNGTASRETEQFIAKVIRENNLKQAYTIVSEAGASVYSASKLAVEEFPDLQVEQRSAVSIARRIIDPLAELVKIDPQAIGVGQYQHDMPQKELKDQLTFVVEKSVNRVGVNVNTASVALLKYVAGLSQTIAQNIVNVRDESGHFTTREQLKKIPRFGSKTYEQAIGFLRIIGEQEPLDQTPIHPENYSKVRCFIESQGFTSKDIMTQDFKDMLNNISATDLSIQLEVDSYTAKDIYDALLAPMRDIRDAYSAPLLKQDVLSIDDLSLGMELEGVVRNIVDFGVFIDIGLKNDGMAHISKLTNKKFLKHPSEIVQMGQILKVYVIDINKEKQKVGLALFNQDS